MTDHKNPVGRPRKPPRVKFSSDLRPEDADFLKEKERAGMRKNAVIDQAFDALRKITPEQQAKMQAARERKDNQGRD